MSDVDFKLVIHEHALGLTTASEALNKLEAISALARESDVSLPVQCFAEMARLRDLVRLRDRAIAKSREVA